VRLYLSSFRTGGHPEHLLALTAGTTAAAWSSPAPWTMRRQMRAAPASSGSWPHWPALAWAPPDPASAATSVTGSASGRSWPGFPWPGCAAAARSCSATPLYRSGAGIVLRELRAAGALAHAGYSAGACVLPPGPRGLEPRSPAPTPTTPTAAARRAPPRATSAPACPRSPPRWPH
jgi:dipeptidase E